MRNVATQFILPSLIRANTLNAALISNTTEKKIKLLDGSWHLPTQARDPYAEFMQHHIPEARFFGIDSIKNEESSLPHMLPSPSQFAKAMDGFEMTRDQHVVIYDACNGLRSACRVWWTFRVFGHDSVSILDGGLSAWRTAGFPVVSSQQVDSKTTHTSYSSVEYRKELVKNMNDIQKNLKEKSCQIVDARSAGRFSGKDPEPRQGLSSGHIPGSINIPASSLLDVQGFFKPIPALKELFQSKLDLKKPIVCTCGSGITASMLSFAFHLIGKKDVPVYDGSWMEWASCGGKIVIGNEK